jgi:hypothetical protein
MFWSDPIQAGRIYFWKFKSDGWLGSEWHFSADEKGTAFFMKLLDRFEAMTNHDDVRLSVTPVTREWLDRCDFDGAYEDRRFLRLVYHPSEGHTDEWSIRDNESMVEISFGRAILRRWRQLLQENVDERELGMGEDYVVFVWK